MRFYFAGAENVSWLKALKKAKAKDALLSYFYLVEQQKENAFAHLRSAAHFQRHIFMDSGGFSAFSKGVKIDVKDYIKFLKENKGHISEYANLDFIGDHRRTMYNQRVMEKAGLRPIPVFHWGSNLDDLKALVGEYDRIALGGLVPHAKQKKKLCRWLDKCFSIIRDKAKVHGFGMSGIEILLRYPWFSCDSTSYISGSKQSTVLYFEQGQFKTISTKNREKANHKSISITDDEEKKWHERVVNNAREYQKMADYITEVWKRRGIKWKD